MFFFLCTDHTAFFERYQSALTLSLHLSRKFPTFSGLKTKAAKSRIAALGLFK